jgi:hypothetical protein
MQYETEVFPVSAFSNVHQWSVFIAGTDQLVAGGMAHSRPLAQALADRWITNQSTQNVTPVLPPTRES